MQLQSLQVADIKASNQEERERMRQCRHEVRQINRIVDLQFAFDKGWDYLQETLAQYDPKKIRQRRLDCALEKLLNRGYMADASDFGEMRELVRAGANVNKDSRLLYMVCQHRWLVDFLKELIEKNIEVNPPKGYYRPLTGAVCGGNKEGVALLLAAGANPLLKEYGKTALKVAQERLKNHEVFAARTGFFPDRRCTYQEIQEIIVLLRAAKEKFKKMDEEKRVAASSFSDTKTSKTKTIQRLQRSFSAPEVLFTGDPERYNQYNQWLVWYVDTYGHAPQ